VWSIAEVAIGGLNLKVSFYRAIPACLTSAWSSITNCHPLVSMKKMRNTFESFASAQRRQGQLCG
jgi:hypothetical protein